MSVSNLFYRIMRHIERESSYNTLMRYCDCGSGISVLGDVDVLNKNVKLGDNVRLYPGVTFNGDGPIEIGHDVKIGKNVTIYATNNAGVKIGDYSIIAANTYIIDSNHRIHLGDPIQSQGLSARKVTVGKDVWIGANSVICKGVSIGDGAVVGASCCISKDVSANEIVSAASVCKKGFRL